MDTQQKIILIVLACVLLALVVTLGCVVVAQNRPVYGEFQVPAWEEHAVQGTPPEPLPPDYGSMAVNEDYVFSMRAAPVLTGQDLTLYFTSPATNTVWLRVKICDTDGTVLYESGLLRPGEYLPLRLQSKKLFADITRLNVNVKKAMLQNLFLSESSCL